MERVGEIIFRLVMLVVIGWAIWVTLNAMVAIALMLLPIIILLLGYWGIRKLIKR